MKAVNVVLSILVSLLMGALVLEGGLRLIGMGPTDSIHQFDAATGWSKRPGATSNRKTSEFDVTYEVNEFGLRDDPMSTKDKGDGVFRVVCLGDSFVLGYTVDRDNLFVDQLEGLWTSEGRKVDVLNAGTEAWSTDQEVVWFLENGESFDPDLVLLFPYENDLYWGGQDAYAKSQKPRFNKDGGREERELADTAAKAWYESYAVGKLLAGFGASGPAPESWSPDGTFQLVGPRMEWAAYFHAAPDFMVDATERTRSALSALKDECARLDADLLMVPIPNKATIHDDALQGIRKAITVAPDMWSPEQPVDTYLALASDLGIASLDVRANFRERAALGERLYFPIDWHLNPEGNRAFAEYLNAELNARGAFPAAHAATAEGSYPSAPTDGGIPRWGYAFGILWLFFGSLYAVTYKSEENGAVAFLKVGGFLTVIFAIVLGGQHLLALVPPALGQMLLIVFIVGLFGFIVFKLGRRVATIVELIHSFVMRGHWYLLPLVVVLMTVGSLLVVAASSPLVAPFIYTLF
jgi:hypothetical protein